MVIYVVSRFYHFLIKNKQYHFAQYSIIITCFYCSKTSYITMINYTVSCDWWFCDKSWTLHM